MPNNLSLQHAEIEQALRALDKVTSSVDCKAIAVAFSGGLDSTVLLHLCARFCAERELSLYAFHVHHGLSKNADRWLEACRDHASALGAIFDSRMVSLAGTKSGIEAEARVLRYAALGEMCAGAGVTLLLTGHHQDDQAETVLMNLLRGSGLAGLSAMSPLPAPHDLLRYDRVRLARPLLNIPRSALERYQSLHALVHVDDESNTDVKYTRNRVRNDIMPHLAAFFPGFQDRFARTASHAQSALRILEEVAVQDLDTCSAPDGICIDTLSTMSEDRQVNLLRHWIGLNNFLVPSTSWMSELGSQLKHVDGDTNVCIQTKDFVLRSYRGVISIAPAVTDAHTVAPSQGHIDLHWKGESSIALPSFGGTLHFDVAVDGIDAHALLTTPLRVRARQPSDNLQLQANRPRRGLKHHYQDKAIPSWERKLLPVVEQGGALVFAAGVGMDCNFIAQSTSNKFIRLRWVRDQ